MIKLTEAEMEAENQRRRAEQLQDRRKLCEMIGLPLICPEAACRRGGYCAGGPSPHISCVPPCHKHYLEEIRFLLYGPDKLLKQIMERKEREACGPVGERPMPKPTSGGAPMTLIDILYGRAPEVLERLRRPYGVRGPGGWNNDPEKFARYINEGDWREPGDLARPKPVNYYGRWIE